MSRVALGSQGFARPTERFRYIIREEFVKMHEEHDVLAEVLAEAQRDVGGQKLPCLSAAYAEGSTRTGARRRPRGTRAVFIEPPHGRKETG